MTRRTVGTLVLLGVSAMTLMLQACDSPTKPDGSTTTTSSSPPPPPPPPPPPDKLAGTYRVTLSAAAECVLPDIAKQRQYTATIQQNESSLSVTLSDAHFLDFRGYRGPALTGTVRGNAVTLRFATDDYYHSAVIAEQLTPDTYATLTGTATGEVTGNTINTILTTLTGTISVSKICVGECQPPFAICTSAGHHLKFTR